MSLRYSNSAISCPIDLKFDVEPLAMHIDNGKIHPASSDHPKKFKSFVTFVEARNSSGKSVKIVSGGHFASSASNLSPRNSRPRSPGRHFVSVDTHAASKSSSPFAQFLKFLLSYGGGGVAKEETTVIKRREEECMRKSRDFCHEFTLLQLSNQLPD